MRLLAALLTATAVAAAQRPAFAQAPADTAAIRQTALDYIDGWYSGDADRMERATQTHVDKRLVYTDKEGHSRLVDRTDEALIQSTRSAVGKIPRDHWRDSVTVLSVFGNDAVVRIDATSWVDFLEEIKWNGSWQLIKVIWENRPHADGPASR